MEVKYTCPFGHTCERAVDGHIERCMLYVEYDAGDGGGSKRDCAIGVQLLLSLNQEAALAGVHNAVESMRNETVKRQDAFISLAVRAQGQKKLENG